MSRNPPITDHTMSTIALQSITAAAARSGITLLRTYRLVSKAWYIGPMVGEGCRG